MPDGVVSRLWRESEDRHAYAILDGAQIENLLDLLHGPHGLKFECLFSGELEPDMAEVAPYLVQLEQDAPFTDWLLNQGWGQNWGIFLVSSDPLPRLWQHLRPHTLVYGPRLQPLYFRFYDPRVMRNFLPTCDRSQLEDFFGHVDFFLSEGAERSKAYAWSIHEGMLVREVIDNKWF